jgi:alpha-galactosidase
MGVMRTPPPSLLFLLVAPFPAASARQTPQSVPLGALDLSAVEQEWGEPHADKSVEQHALTIGGRKFESGLGTHASSQMFVDLGGSATRLHAFVGADDETLPRKGSVVFRVLADGTELWKSGLLRTGDAPKELDVPLAGVKTLLLLVEDGGDGNSYDHADWALATIEAAAGAKIVSRAAPREPAVVLTPAAPPQARLHGPRVAGERPISFAATNLPPGLELDAESGRISGTLPAKGSFRVTLQAKNARGRDERELRIVCGDAIALTPPLGWNSWNCFANAVDDAKVRSAADAMVASGLAQHGWTYINIDDCWEAGRDAQGNIQSNEKFPDMKALGDYVHSKGLRFGIYSSPGPQTCAGFTASWQHEEQDARTWAAWGVDYVKYDWCSYDGIAKDKSLPELQKPYSVMRAALDKAPRDIVFSLCQYGMGDVWKWGADVGGNCWRTTGDINDSWSSMAGIGFAQDGHEKHAGPGHWNDPDMLVVGKVGWGNLHPTKLTPNEQYTHISLWCLLCSPLLIGCDMAQLDEFTLNLLTNDEVLDVNQDPLGKQAARVAQQSDTEVWSKELEDGSLAVGFFNRGAEERSVSVTMSDLGLDGAHKARDLWRQKDLGTYKQSIAMAVPRHGVVLLRVFPTGAR